MEKLCPSSFVSIWTFPGSHPSVILYVYHLLPKSLSARRMIQAGVYRSMQSLHCFQSVYTVSKSIWNQVCSNRGWNSHENLQHISRENQFHRKTWQRYEAVLQQHKLPAPLGVKAVYRQIDPFCQVHKGQEGHKVVASSYKLFYITYFYDIDMIWLYYVFFFKGIV